MGALPVNYDIFQRRNVQKALNEKTRVSPALVIDGNFGAKSVAALQTFQKANNLTPDGVYGPATQALLDPFINQKYANMADMQSAAATLGLPLALVVAVCETEAKGSGFFSDGTCQILFERHWMYQLLVTAKTKGVADGLSNRYPSVINPTPGGYSGGPAEYQRLNLAMTVDQSCALQSASWGLFQIMGLNYTFCGYSSIFNYVADMKLSEKKHVTAFVSYIQKYRGGALWNALKAQNFLAFATGYNGKGNAQDYATRTQNNFTLWKQQLAA